EVARRLPARPEKRLLDLFVDLVPPAIHRAPPSVIRSAQPRRLVRAEQSLKSIPPRIENTRRALNQYVRRMTIAASRARGGSRARRAARSRRLRAARRRRARGTARP